MYLYESIFPQQYSSGMSSALTVRVSIIKKLLSRGTGNKEKNIDLTD